jgi:hypothetical protein
MLAVILLNNNPNWGVSLRTTWVKFCCCVLLVVFPLSMAASDAVGILESSGAVTIDGRPSTSRSPVFEGETIRTGDSERAIVTARGMVIALAQNSEVTLDEVNLRLRSGTIVIGGAKAAVKVNGVRIAASAPDGKFLVNRVDDDLKVVALKGDLLVGEGQDQTPVPATKGLHVPKDKNSSNGKNSGNNPARTDWLSNPDIGVLIVVGAAIAAGVTLGIVNSVNSQKSSSPPSP